MTRAELKKKLSSLGELKEHQKMTIICSLIGHSRIQTSFFGYYNCGRCDEQLGDSLGGMYMSAPDVVVRGHKCKVCKSNFKKCTWMDKLYVRDPFVDDFGKEKKGRFLQTL